MIRPLLVVKRQSVEGELEEKLKPIAEAFALYLSMFRTEKASNSKHGRMGPVGKILSRMRQGKRGSQVLGEAIRIHEMAAKKTSAHSSPQISVKQLQALEEAVNGLSDVLRTSTSADHSRIIAHVDASVYYYLEQRKKSILLRGQEEFRQYLMSKYASVEELRAEWEESTITWEWIPYPSKNTDNFKNPKVRADVQAFLQQRTQDPTETEQADVEELEV